MLKNLNFVTLDFFSVVSFKQFNGKPLVILGAFFI